MPETGKTTEELIETLRQLRREAVWDASEADVELVVAELTRRGVDVTAIADDQVEAETAERMSRVPSSMPTELVADVLGTVLGSPEDVSRANAMMSSYVSQVDQPDATYFVLTLESGQRFRFDVSEVTAD